jgi:GNAT superfamily N-acetyltransferase
VIGPDRLAGFMAEACVPEQVIKYVCAVAGSHPKRFGMCVAYLYAESRVLVGYPLHAPADAAAMNASLADMLRVPGPERITVIGPARPAQAPARATSSEDHYYALPIPPPNPSQKLRNMLRRAGREVTLAHGRGLTPDHRTLVERYLAERHLPMGTRHIFRNIGAYLEACPTSLVVSARRDDGRLAGFSVGEYGSLHTALFMFSFRDPEAAVPGCADLLLKELLDEAARRGQIRMNLGLGVSPGIRRFKEKWGAERFLPYVETTWEGGPAGFFARLFGFGPLGRDRRGGSQG